ncbi:MAG: hypothetical protein GVX78_04505 [Bacteroidetes bacterium]|jgi:hypothetical protein|nr:hypothetical protein [Bacteroidota bacterium]
MNDKLKKQDSLNISLQKGGKPTEPIDIPENVAKEILRFEGDPGSPFLAPRGVFFDGKHIIVSDTGQNRLFIWESPLESVMVEPKVILGQSNHELTGRNRKGQVDASTLHYPSGLWSNGKCLIVADAWNHRVLIWHEFPTSQGQSADVVVGQPNFTSNEPNAANVGATPTSQSLHWPYGVTVFNNKLIIADTGNRRVLVFDDIPKENYPAASYVIGKNEFSDRDYDPLNPIWPYSVKLNEKGCLAITDTQYYRVLVWKNWNTAFSNKADVIIGQSNFEENGQNQFGLHPKSHTLNWCYDSHFYKDGIIVADTGNSRLLWFPTVPEENNSPAAGVIGKPNFNTGSEFSETQIGTHQSLYWPFSISIDSRNSLLYLADTGNHRLVIYKLLI